MQPTRRRILGLAASVIAAGLIPGAVIALARRGHKRTLIASEPGAQTVLSPWWIQSSSRVHADGATLSRPDFAANGWYPVATRSTVMAGLVQNGRYKRIFYSTKMRDEVSTADFAVPWWYRTEFTVAPNSPPRTFLQLPGVVSRADVWLNGKQLAGKDSFAGAWNAMEFDVSRLVRAGRSAIAIRVYPADPQRDFEIFWSDWAQPAPDNGMGLWRDVTVRQDGAVSVRRPYARADLALPGLDRANLTVTADLRNNEGTPRTALIHGVITGPDTAGKPVRIEFSQTVKLRAQQTRKVTFAPDRYPQLALDHPSVWWPAQLGSQPLYLLSIDALEGGRLSSRDRVAFGIRDVQSRLSTGGHRQFLINGQPLLIRGAGWAPDLFMRFSQQRLENQFHYIADLGLNAIRLEGALETHELYDLADRKGILVLPGWECCCKWQQWDGWSAADFEIAAGSMRNEALLLRSHPSVIAFLIGSDYAPPENVQQMYLSALRAADWPNPVISAASDQAISPPLGPSGLKMTGPYDWVPPGYWYAGQLGAAFGFNSETSAGHSIPALDSLHAMLSAAERDQLWRDPAAPQYHSGGPGSDYAKLTVFGEALAQRYGAPDSLADYVQKAQLANYEMTRAQFEAFSRNATAADPATGVIYWMLNNAWPSLNWHLFDYYLNPAGAYFGAKKANEALHIQYSYDDQSVVVVNQGPQAAGDLTVRADVYDLDGTPRFSDIRHGIGVNSLGVASAMILPQLPGLSRTYFVRLRLDDASGQTVSRNTYWLSAQPDVADWAASNPGYTPVSQYADLRDLTALPAVTLGITARSARPQPSGGRGVTTVSLRNTAQAVALAVSLTMRRGDGSRVLPVVWSDNYVSLWPGESISLSASYPQQPPPLAVEVGGCNVVPRTVASA